MPSCTPVRLVQQPSLQLQAGDFVVGFPSPDYWMNITLSCHCPYLARKCVVVVTHWLLHSVCDKGQWENSKHNKYSAEKECFHVRAGLGIIEKCSWCGYHSTILFDDFGQVQSKTYIQSIYGFFSRLVCYILLWIRTVLRWEVVHWRKSTFPVFDHLPQSFGNIFSSALARQHAATSSQ